MESRSVSERSKREDEDEQHNDELNDRIDELHTATTPQAPVMSTNNSVVDPPMPMTNSRMSNINISEGGGKAPQSSLMARLFGIKAQSGNMGGGSNNELNPIVSKKPSKTQMGSLNINPDGSITLSESQLEVNQI